MLDEYPPERVAAITGVDVATIETLAHRYAREQPSLIRLNYGLQRHHGGGMAVRTIACLPAIVGSWRHHGGGALLSTSGTYDFAMDRLTRPDLSPPGTRTVNMNQLGEALAGELPGPPVRALYVYNCNPAAVAPDQAQGARRAAPRRPVHRRPRAVRRPTPSTTPTSSCRRRRSSSTSTSTARTAITDVMLNPPAIAPRGECRSNNDVFRALAAPARLRARALPRRRDLDPRGPRRRPDPRGDHARAAARPKGSVRLNLPETYAPFADGRVPDALGQVRALLRADEGRRPRPAADLHPAARRPADPSRPGRAVPAPAPQPAPAAVPQLDVRQLSRTIAPRPATRRSSSRPRTPQPRGLVDGQWAEVYNDRGRFQARVALTGSVRPGVAVATGIYWNKLTPGRSNVNSTTSSALTDMGGGATFFDNLVEVRP